MNPIELKKTMLKCCTGLALVTLLSACGSNDNGTPAPITPPIIPPAPISTGVSFAAKIQPIFNTHCNSCHTRTGIASILVLDSGTYTNLVNRPSVAGTGTLVIPGDSANSVLYERISKNGLLPTQLQMPLGGPFLSADDQNLIKTWIDEGAKNN